MPWPYPDSRVAPSAPRPPAGQERGDAVTETSIRRLFERYEQLFERALTGKADMDEVTSVYAPAFVGASPAGIVAGKNDDHLKQAMEQGYRHYRAIGTKMMRIRDVRISPIDDH